MLIYVGPDQIIPLSGALGTIAGLALIFWHKVVHVARTLFGFVSTKPSTQQDPQS